ncbi:MAG: four helix bundle protein, partial [Flavobacteriales bacterium]
METQNTNSPVKSYKNLIVWNASMNLVHDIYRISSVFPKSEQLILTSQMRRAAISVPSNIAEGWGRNSARSFKYFLKIASGSTSELMTQLEIALRLNYITPEKANELILKGNQISKMLIAL